MTPEVLNLRGPKGARVGDVVHVDGSRWRVEAIDHEHREAVCRLLAGSHALRRFRARAIARVERQPNTPAAQLAIDGGETPVALVGRGSSTPLTQSQREILRLVADHDVTSTDAGRILHLLRNPPCHRCELGRCGFAASDGGDALKRLAVRGFVRRVAPGVWTAREKAPLAR